MNNWQKDIYAALEKEGSFDMKNWMTKSENDDNGLGFMEDVAYYKNVYEYLNHLGLVNRGFCPITGEKIDGSFNYAIYGRTIFVSERALEIGKEKKQKFREKFQKEHPEFQSNLKNAQAFLDGNPNIKESKPRFGQDNPFAKPAKNYENTTFFLVLILSGFGSYKLVNPSSIIGYIGVLLVFIVLFNIGDWLRKKL